MYQAQWIDNRWRCPRCGVKPTLYLSDCSSLCLNCKHRWLPNPSKRSDPPADRPPHSGSLADRAPLSYPPVPAYPFSADEVRRLKIYRAAILAGFFTDVLQTEPAAW